MIKRQLGEMLEVGDQIISVHPPKQDSKFGHVMLSVSEGPRPVMYTIEAVLWDRMSEYFNLETKCQK